MKKDKVLQNLAKKRHIKNLRRKGKKYNSKSSFNHRRLLNQAERRIIASKSSPTATFLKENNAFKNSSEQVVIVFPKNFSFTENYSSSINAIYAAIQSFDKIHNKTIILSFKNCRYIETSCLFILEQLLLDVFKYKLKIQNNYSIDIINRLEIEKSKNDSTNKRLCLLDNRIISEISEEDNDLLLLEKFSYQGAKTSKSYIEGKKLTTCKNIINFLNKQLFSTTDFVLTEQGRNNFEGIIGETIDNAEQHSNYRGEWNVSAYFFKDHDKSFDDTVVEVHLHFFNLGATIYESFLGRKVLNDSMHKKICDQVNLILSKDSYFSNENIFTLLSLNEGVSSLNYENASRGTGMISLLKQFFEIGDFEDSSRGLNPLMAILSGKTLLKINNKYKVYSSAVNGEDRISLNKFKSLKYAPDKKHVLNLNHKFPGTLISLRVYLNNKHLKNKFA
ncbi:MAG: hypothetical protein ACSHW7_03195 [Patiriisocius sp.]|uniref:hypothetical protein n=1 Tax=Patiriisocius sp. TaxID=2822396 RepID=UPI003EF5BA51